MGKLKLTFHVEDLFDDHDTADGCFYLYNDTFYPYSLDINFTYQLKEAKIIFRYDIAAIEAIQEQTSFLGPASSLDVSTLIRHKDDVETIDFDSQINFWDKMRDTAVQIPSALERDIKLYGTSNKY